MFNPEREAMRHSNFDAAFQRALKVLDEDGIDPESFRDLYGNTNVNRDLVYVADRKARFAKEDRSEQGELRKLAKIFEAIVHEQAEMSNWLGEDAHTIRPSEFDDIANGVDSIVEFQQGDTAASHLALAIDVTFNSQAEDKLRRIKKEIEQGEMSHIRYFESEFMGFRGELSQVPRVIIGADRKAVGELVEMWMEGGPRALADHPIQQQIVREIAMQLEAFSSYARSKNQTEVASVYTKTQGIVDGIILEKAKKRPTLPDSAFAGDEVFEGIRVFLKNFK